MDFGGMVFFIILGAIFIVPSVLRHQERQRLHDTIRECLAKGQTVPPELWMALRSRRRVYTSDYPAYPNGWTPQPQPQPAASPYTLDPVGQPLGAAAPGSAEPFTASAPPSAPPPPLFIGPSLIERDLRRGIVWLAIGLGLVAAGAAFYAGLYYDGGAPEVFSSFAALGAIPAFVGLTYLALWFFNRKTKV